MESRKILVLKIAILLHILICVLPTRARVEVTQGPLPLKMSQYPAPDGHRCGVCPTYEKKRCGCTKGETRIFHNHCVMDLYNCVEGTAFKDCWFANCVFD